MKKYLKELVIGICQLFMFYIFPLFAGPTDVIGMVILIIFATLILSFVLGIISKNIQKLLYPVFAAIAFLPTVFIYYNESALVHSWWYFVISSTGILIGSIIHLLIFKRK